MEEGIYFTSELFQFKGRKKILICQDVNIIHYYKLIVIAN